MSICLLLNVDRRNFLDPWFARILLVGSFVVFAEIAFCLLFKSL